MLRFASLLREGLSARGFNVVYLFPQEIFGKLSYMFPRFVKWLRYIDKFVIFPQKLRRIAKNCSSDSVFHICDHSNAMYGSALKSVAHLVTCHDILAIRGSLGDASAYCPASHLGVILQKWILSSIKKIPYVACVSIFTSNDLQKILFKSNSKCKLSVVSNALNAKFLRIEKEDSQKILSNFIGSSMDWPFLLHVGSSLARKNRILLLRALQHLPDEWRVVFAGAGLSMEELNCISNAGIKDRVIAFKKPSHDELCALYSIARALVFPSWSEGFGWPVIEAQACGCPVICSNLTSLPEVAGDAAIFISADDPLVCADAVQRLEVPAIRNEFIKKGFQNSKRFNLDKMIDAYEDLYKKTLIR
jgi:glycosyltransferase involved in cell wall biosynthesis